MVQAKQILLVTILVLIGVVLYALWEFEGTLPNPEITVTIEGAHGNQVFTDPR